MATKRVAIVAAILCLALSAIAQSVSYPRMKGIVSDYAGKLTPAQVNELSGMSKAYEKQTSIEFVVVIAKSLNGETAGEYARTLGERWKIGKKGLNNGVVLLWAPNDRAYALRFADGLMADMTDVDAKEITDDYLLPHFKEEDYYTGLKQTVLATMAKLGHEDWQSRLQVRVEQEKRRAAEAQAQVQRRTVQEEAQRHADKVFGLGFVAVMGILGISTVFVYRAQRRKDEMNELTHGAATIANNLAIAEKNAPELQKLLDDFAKEMPEQDISQFREALKGQSDRVLKIKVDAQCVNFADRASYNECVRVHTESENESKLLESTRQSLAQIREAKAQSQALMDLLSRERFEVDRIRNYSREAEINRLLYDSRQYYYQARQNSSMSVVDWMMINRLLNNSHQQMQQAVQYSLEEPYVPSSYSSSSSSSSSSASSFFSSSSSDSSSSSGGGGGGFSGGSGSEGSY